jgi:2-polyprenyl-3-methyl-5-hydroxy-6-metoxy-1,4-benzoquinol methylase
VSAYVANVDLAKLGVGPGDRVVDLGCGEGALAELLARAGLHVTGVEPAAYLRERFTARVGAVDPESDVVDGLADALPFGDGELGPVVTTEVLEHVPDPEAALRELHRAMRPGAVLCLSVPTSFTELLFWRLHPGYAENATHLRIFTKPELRRLIDVTGFDLVAWEGRNFKSALLWTFHAALRSPSDHTGQILGNAWMTRIVDAGWRALQLVGLAEPVERAGNRLWPKSWYVYCRRR